MRGWAILAASAALAGCGGGSGGTPLDNATVPAAKPAPAPAKAVAARSPATDLSRYVGKYPSDPLDGRTFMTEPAVRAAVERATADPAIRRFVLAGAGPESPIAMKDGNVTAWGCEQHNCGDHNWTVQMSRDGASGGLCIEDAARGQATWYAGGRPDRRSETCPEAG